MILTVNVSIQVAPISFHLGTHVFFGRKKINSKPGCMSWVFFSPKVAAGKNANSSLLHINARALEYIILEPCVGYS